MSSSDKISPGSLTAYERWELPLVNNEQEITRKEQLKEIRPPSAQEIEQMFRQARDTGYQEGYTEGKQAGYQESYEQEKKSIEENIAMLTQVINKLESPLQDMDRLIIDQLYSMLRIICERVIHRSLDNDQALIIKVINSAMAELPVNEVNIRIRLNPVDAEFVTAHIQEITMPSASNANHYIIADESVSRGGCIVESRSSEIDASLETRISKIFDELYSE